MNIILWRPCEGPDIYIAGTLAPKKGRARRTETGRGSETQCAHKKKLFTGFATGTSAVRSTALGASKETSFGEKQPFHSVGSDRST